VFTYSLFSQCLSVSVAIFNFNQEEKMPFTLIKGRFKPMAGTPDGDSIRFLADDIKLWKNLEGRSVELGTGPETKNTAQLRLDGVDAIEKGAAKPLSEQARDSLFKMIGFDEKNNPEPRGFILTRMTDDVAGRPITLAFRGTTRKNDGATVFADGPLLRESINVHQARAGFAYPLYYNTLFAELRRELDEAINLAKEDKAGLWPADRTTQGVTVKSQADLATIAPIWPKLWRRLDEYLRKNKSLSGFVQFLEKSNERVDVLNVMEERGFQDLVEVRNSTVRMIEPPENLRFVAQAGRRSR
jgi:endonuclease YncB( thermonuclease family)